ncbi:FecCD family ABC transporter permease [Paenibacillus sanguinis]|uniref:FecCD family ABC transporter permease n=1 Tax=Paenibacillus sanguinis TaxID=225906 RepID=UPI00036D42A0|nr:iron chelate uptake ABC transporter family permease subunit [Paenibacillus sanguinis]
MNKISVAVRIRVRNTSVILLLAIIAAVLAVVNIGIGAVPISVVDIWQALAGQGDPDLTHIIIHYRMPRILLALLVGSALAVSGLIAQTILLNPLAAPDTLGISSGAAIGAVLLMVSLQPELQSYGLSSIAAFAGGALGAMLVYALAYRNGLNPVRLGLVGVAVSACGSTLVQLLVIHSSMNTNTVLLWLNGSLWGQTWAQVSQLGPIVLLLIPVAWALGTHLDILHLGDISSKGLGMRVELVRFFYLFLAVLLTSSSIAVVGMIGFVGLVSPHMARRMVRGGHRIYIPVAALIGSIMLLLADTLGRSVAPPIEFPAGLITALIGAPYFLYLLRREFRRQR